jgi:hypothetical protein
VLQPGLAARLSSIDGAVLCDTAGLCHAVGVILDGPAVAAGDRGRGARFNSAVRYVNAHSRRSAAIVVSEDGGLDLLPKLRPALQRSTLLRKLEQLQLAACGQLSKSTVEMEDDLVNWIGRHEFYLNPEQCTDANSWIAQIDVRHATERPGIEPVRVPLKPDPDFDAVRDLR